MNDDDDNKGNAGIPFIHIPNNRTVTHHHITTNICILMYRNYIFSSHVAHIHLKSPIAAITHLYGSLCAMERIQSHDERMNAEKNRFRWWVIKRRIHHSFAFMVKSQIAVTSGFLCCLKNNTNDGRDNS